MVKREDKFYLIKGFINYKNNIEIRLKESDFFEERKKEI